MVEVSSGASTTTITMMKKSRHKEEVIRGRGVEAGAHKSKEKRTQRYLHLGTARLLKYIGILCTTSCNKYGIVLN